MSSIRRQLERRIRKNESEIQRLVSEKEELLCKVRTLDDEIRTAEASIAAYRDALGLVPITSTESSGATEFRSGSIPARAYDALKASGAPLHVTELILAMGGEVSRSSRTTISGSLSNYVRKGEIFTRPAGNTFGLLEWEAADRGVVAGDQNEEDEEDEVHIH